MLTTINYTSDDPYQTCKRFIVLFLPLTQPLPSPASLMRTQLGMSG